MADTLTPQERAAIAAFPEARVQRVPQGVSGEAQPQYVYDPAATGRVSGGLRAKNPGWTKDRRDSGSRASLKRFEAARAKEHERRRALVEARKQSIRDMTLAGISQAQQAKTLGVCSATLEKDIRELRAAGLLPAPTRGKQG